jgi:hypothetical protein
MIVKPRLYNSISQAVNDNRLAKIYAGWYFRKAAADGYQMGREVTAHLFQNAFKERI